MGTAAAGDPPPSCAGASPPWPTCAADTPTRRDRLGPGRSPRGDGPCLSCLYWSLNGHDNLKETKDVSIVRQEGNWQIGGSEEGKR